MQAPAALVREIHLVLAGAGEHYGLHGRRPGAERRLRSEAVDGRQGGEHLAAPGRLSGQRSATPRGPPPTRTRTNPIAAARRAPGGAPPCGRGPRARRERAACPRGARAAGRPPAAPSAPRSPGRTTSTPLGRR